MSIHMGWTREEAEFAVLRWGESGLPTGLLGALFEAGAGASLQTGVAKQLERFVDSPDDVSGGVSDLDFWKTLASPDAESLTLSSIELFNFLLYEHVKIDTRFEPARPVIVIEGKNGYGKSSLIRAIRFVLAGDIEGGGIAHFIHAGASGNQAEARVILEFNSRELGTFDIRRIQTYRRGLDTWIPSESHLTVNIKPMPLQGEEAQRWVKTRFPTELLDYYVFDAESSVVRELSGQKGTELPPVKNAVEAALNISSLRETALACTELGKTYSLKNKRLKSDQDKQNRKRRKLEDQLLDLNYRIEEAAQSIRMLDKELSAAEAEVARYQDKAHPELQLRREGILSEREKFRARVALAEKQRLQVFTESLPLALLGCAVPEPAVTSAEARSQEWRRGAEEASESIAGKIASGGFPWVRNAPSAEEVARILRESIGLTREEDSPGDTNREALARVFASAVRAGRELRTWLESDRLSHLQERLQDIELELRETATPEDSRLWLDEHVRTRGIRDAAADRLREARQSLKALKKEKAALEDDSVSGGNSSPESSEIARFTKLQDASDRIADALMFLADGLLARRIRQLEIDASQMLVRTAHKHNVLSEIRIDPGTYRYKVLDSNGRPAPAGRSTGERNLLALCLVHAIRKAAGAGLPMVVEAPLRVLDPLHRESVLRELLCQYPGQMLLLVTPEEIPKGNEYLIRDRVSRRLILVRNRDSEVSDVVESGYGDI